MPRWKLYLIRIARLLAHPQLWRFLLRRRTRYVITWLVVLIASAFGFYATWTAFDNPKRTDGNDGHTAIDFGGQYLMGRMLIEGHGRQLYNRDYQRKVLNQAYPRHLGDPASEKPDADSLLEALILVDRGPERPSAERMAAFLSLLAVPDSLGTSILAANERRMTAPDIGGPLYPPVNAFLYAPLALLSPQPAYHLMQAINLTLAFAAGLGLALLSDRRVWWPIAAGFVMLYPGYNGSITLGQNATLSLAILVGGWVFIARGKPGLGGVVWGFFVFKPVWALAFFLVPLLTRRWRTCAAMIVTGAGLALATLPFVGLQPWLDWQMVGAEASATYTYDSNWIPLSRDLLSMPRRWFDFEKTIWTDRRDNQTMAIIGWTILGAVFALTALLPLLRRRQTLATTGVPAAYVMLGAFLCCFHFMYYDVLISALPVFLLYTEPWRYLDLRFLALIPVAPKEIGPDVADYYRPRICTALPATVPPRALDRGRLWVINRVIPTLTVILIGTPPLLYQILNMGSFNVPADTICLILIWLWCGWTWLRMPADAADLREPEEESLPTISRIYAPKFIQRSANIGSTHERLAD